MSEFANESGAPPLGTVLRGGYQLLRFLGKGGMGAVYEASAPNGQRVAVKVLLEEALRVPEVVQRFKREALITAALDHPNVVRLIDGGVDPALDIPFMVMPLLVGLDLSQLLERVGPLHPAVAARIFRQAASALDAAHRAGAVHRDLKPANLFLDHGRDGLVTVRMLDFGVAKWMPEQGQNLTGTRAFLGTPYYISPEQLESTKRVDHRSDLWSLGVSLFETLTGELPFDGVTLVELCAAVLGAEPRSVQDLAPWVEPGLAAVVRGVLVRKPEGRCPSAHDLREALAPFTAGDDRIGAGMLVGLEPRMRSYRAQTATRLPASWGDVHVTGGALRGPELGDAEADAFVGTTIAGRYNILWQLGRGGMGAVYEAEGPDRNRYAVKVIDLDAAGKSETLRRRFLREAKATTAIQSEHVVRVVEAGADGPKQVPYMVMELLRGADLADVLHREGAIRPEVAARLFVQACRGMGVAHAQGLVHRDIKPANLYLHELPSGEAVLKVCDFGVVKRMLADERDDATAALTHTGGVIGSPMYMSPEQAQNARDIDARSDVWSLGASLYQALTGVMPWEGREGVGQLIVAICTSEPVHVQDRAPWVAPGLADVVHRAMRRDVAERFASVQELAAALESFTGGRTTVNKDELGGVPGAVRSRVAPRAPTAPAVTVGSIGATVGGATLAATAATLAGASVLQTGQAAPAAPRRRPLALGVLAVAGVAVGVAIAVGAAGSSPSTAASAAPVPSPASATARQRAVELEIAPATAQVTVDGASRPLAGGKLELRGEVGDSFVVVVSDGGRRVERTVVITKEGAAEPPSLALEAEPAPSTSAAVSPPSGVGGPKPPVTTPKVGPSALPPPPPTAPPKTTTTPTAREKW